MNPSSNRQTISVGDNPVKLSIVIRSRNEGVFLHKVLDALKAQICSFCYEIIIVDNESTDGTREMCQHYNVRIVNISKSEFTYGRAINLGIENAKGDIILLLSAHSLPIGPDFLIQAVKPFDNNNVGAARCIRITDINDINNWYQPKIITPSTHFLDIKQVLKWYPSASCCVLKREVWEQVRFDEVLEFNEDKFWASEIVKKGYYVVNCASAMYCYMRNWETITKLLRLNKSYLALYRATGYKPMDFQHFIIQVIRTVFLCPYIALEYLITKIAESFLLFTIPFQAKLTKPSKGSLEGYDSNRANFNQSELF